MKVSTLSTLLLLPSIAAAQSGTRSTNVGMTATRAADITLPSANVATATTASSLKVSTAPVLDGKLDDAAWNSAQSINQFLEYEPNQGAESRFRTDVRVVHDDKYLYIMARIRSGA